MSAMGSVVLALGACGSQADLRPPSAPAPSPPAAERSTLPGAVRPATAPAPRPVRRVSLRDGRLVAELDPVARELVVRERVGGEVLAREPAGAGPAQLATDGEELIWVTDAQLDALLVFQVESGLALSRRVALPGAPWALAYDAPRERLWITLTARNEVAAVRAGESPGIVGTYDTLRAPRSIAVADRGTVSVRAGNLIHRVDPGRIEELDPAPPDGLG